MNNEQSKDPNPMTDRERGRAFLEGFKKMPYNRDRIGQSFVMKACVVSKPTTEEKVPKTSSKAQ